VDPMKERRPPSSPPPLDPDPAKGWLRLGGLGRSMAGGESPPPPAPLSLSLTLRARSDGPTAATAGGRDGSGGDGGLVVVMVAAAAEAGGASYSGGELRWRRRQSGGGRWGAPAAAGWWRPVGSSGSGGLEAGRGGLAVRAVVADVFLISKNLFAV
jgi:hypothetical protein